MRTLIPEWPARDLLRDLASAQRAPASCADAAERRRLDRFETAFNNLVWYACFPPVRSRLCYLFRNRALMGKSVIDDPARQIIRAPLVMGLAVEHARMHFGLALLRADAPALAA